jgi:hypothetical protein
MQLILYEKHKKKVIKYERNSSNYTIWNEQEDSVFDIAFWVILLTFLV